MRNGGYYVLVIWYGIKQLRWHYFKREIHSMPYGFAMLVFCISLWRLCHTRPVVFLNGASSEFYLSCIAAQVTLLIRVYHIRNSNFKLCQTASLDFTNDTLLCILSNVFQELLLDSNPKPLIFILHSFLAAKVSRLGLLA